MFFLPLLAGQAPDAVATANRPSEGTAVIKLNVVVNDKSGKPVPDLEQKDFTIIDNKQPQPILSFEAVSGAHAKAEPVEVIIIIDAVNLPYTRVAYARDQLKRFLKQEGGQLTFPAMIGFLTDKGLDVQGVPTRDETLWWPTWTRTSRACEPSIANKASGGATTRCSCRSLPSTNSASSLAECPAVKLSSF
jgi:hypothetical protein